MALALGTAAAVLVVLLCELARPRVTHSTRQALTSRRQSIASWRARRVAAARAGSELGYDPGRERRAEQRARALLRSCIDGKDWAMYNDLGFLRVWGGAGGVPRAAPTSYAYLIYPHRPIVAYVPQTGVLLNEYCVTFPDHSRPFGSARLPDSDDVLAKWLALSGDEHGLIAGANMHLPGRQIDPDRIRRDLERLRRWEHERAGRRAEPDRSVLGGEGDGGGLRGEGVRADGHGEGVRAA